MFCLVCAFALLESCLHGRGMIMEVRLLDKGLGWGS